MGWLDRRRRRGAPRFRPVVLVTGCSSGVGLELAHMLEEHSEYRVVVTARARSLSRIHEAGIKESERLWIRALDVTDRKQRVELVSEIGKHWDGVNVLINNAGISYRSVVEHMSEEEDVHQLSTNYIGPMDLIRLVLPYMRDLGRGKIINVSSVSGMLAMPTMSAYSASKFALEGASESLWYELRPLGVNVTLIQPGFIRSSSFQNVYYSEEASRCDVKGNEPYSDYYRNMGPFVGRMMNRSLATPKSVSLKILKVVKTENPRLRVPATLDARVFYYLRRWLPRRIFHRILFAVLPGARKWGRGYSHARRLKTKPPPADVGG
jgi:short-subunit dehydrogenase